MKDEDSLLKYLENALFLLADHHAITGSSFKDSFGLVPSYTDIWVENRQGQYLVVNVKEGSPADRKLFPGDSIIRIGGIPIERAVVDFWSDLSVDMPTQEQRAYAARVLVTGRRNMPRKFTISREGKVLKDIILSNLYAVQFGNKAKEPLETIARNGIFRIKIHDSLGEHSTIEAFDAAMAKLPSNTELILDLSDTPSGGNTTVARAIMGWFVDQPRPYQMHSSPEEFRETGIERQWAEYVLPRKGKHFSGKLIIHVGRWTGSMGEGLAIGFDALGYTVCGNQMAGLLGAVEDISLERTGAVIKLPTERLSAIDGTPREKFIPHALDEEVCALDRASL